MRAEKYREEKNDKMHTRTKGTKRKQGKKK